MEEQEHQNILSMVKSDKDAENVSKDRFLRVPEWLSVRPIKEIGQSEKLAYGVIRSKIAIGNGWYCWIYVANLAYLIGVSKDSAKRILRYLESRGLINRVKRKTQDNISIASVYYTRTKNHPWKKEYEKSQENTFDRGGTDDTPSGIDDTEGVKDAEDPVARMTPKESSIIKSTEKKVEGNTTVGIKEKVFHPDANGNISPSDEQADLIRFLDKSNPVDLFLQEYHKLWPHKHPFSRILGNVDDLKDARARIEGLISVTSFDYAIDGLQYLTSKGEYPNSSNEAVLLIHRKYEQEQKQKKVYRKTPQPGTPEYEAYWNKVYNDK